MGPSQILPLWVKVDWGVMAMKRYSTLPRSPEYDQMQFSIIPMKHLLLGFDPPAEDVVSIF